MPDRKLARRRTLWRLILFNLLDGVLALLGGAPARRSGRPTGPIWPKPIEPETAEDPTPAFIGKGRLRSRRRFATSLAFVTLFFAGAAFSAGAGDVVVDLLESDEPAVEEASADDSETTQDTGEPEEPVADTEESPTQREGEADQEPADSPSEGEESPESGSNGETETEPADEIDEESPPEAGGEEAVEEHPAEDPGETESSETPAEESDAGTPVDEARSDDEVATDTSAEHPDEPVETPAAEPVEDGAELPESTNSETDAATSELDETSAVEDSVHESEGATEAAESEEPKENEAPPLVKPKAKSERVAQPEPEIESEFATATVWLHRELPDPTPPARRLKWTFAQELKSVAADNKIDWALVLAVLRAKGYRGSTPATQTELEEIAASLTKLGARKDEWAALLAYSGRTAFADRAQALARYNRAVGLRSLVRGLDAAKEDLADKVLDDPRIWIYGGGRTDIEAGRIDVRVLVLMLYLAEAHDQVTVSSLFAGHRLYARPGVISAHIYGLAVDIAALGGQSILGNSQPGGITEKAVRNILLLPAELQPQQVISLLGLGGPSFPLADHADHIHVGY